MEHRLQRSVATPTSVELAGFFYAETKRWKGAWKKRLAVAMLLLSDVLFAVLVWEGAHALQTIWGQGSLSSIAAASVVPNVALWVGLRALLGLYPGYGLDQVEKLRRHTYAVLATVATVAIFAMAFQIGNYLSRPQLILGFLGLLLLAPLVRYFAEWGTRKAGLWGNPVVILGSGEAGARVTKLLQQKWKLGYKPVAAFDYRLTFGEVLPEDQPCGDHRKSLTGVVDLARKQGLDTVIFAMPHTRREQMAELVNWASITFRHVLIMPNLGGITNSAVVARDLEGTFALEIKHNLLNPWALRVKRTMDVFGAVVGGLLISPLLAAMVILIKLDDPGPAFYGHQRLGAGESRFRCWKFRTMRPHAERLLDEYLQSNPHLRAEWEQNQKLRSDPRVTRVGRLLRRTSLDELPQLWNVLLGEMSLIGPRPIVDAEVPKYGEAYELYERIKPGMSGLWQVSGRSDTSYLERVAMDTYYVRNWSVWLDLIILARTIKVVVLGRGSY